jgi:MscS family membrane protein
MDALENWYLLENSAFDLILFLGIILLGIALKRFFSNSFSKIVFRFIPEESISIQDCVQLLRKPFELLIFWIFLYLAAQNLKVPSQWNFTPIQDFGILFLVKKAFEIAIIYTVTWVIVRLMKVVILVAQEKWQGVEQKSKQQFTNSYNNFEYNVSHQISLKILPLGTKNKTTDDIKHYCTECGIKTKSKYKFCPSCGNKI